MRLNPDDDDDFYNEDYDYDDEEEEVKPKSSFKKREKEDTFTDDYKEKPDSNALHLKIYLLTSLRKT